MQILVLGKYYPPYRGGIETLTRNWCEGFVRLGGKVRCVVANENARTIREDVDGVDVLRCGQFGTPLSTPASPRYLWEGRRGGADIIQLHFPNPLADLTMALAPRGTPLIVTYHSDIVRQAGLMALYQPLLTWLLRRAHKIVVATPPQLAHSKALQPFKEKCEVIPFGLDLARFEKPDPPVPEVIAASRDAAGKPILLNIGRLVGYKGQRYLIEALRHVDAVAWLVGSGPLRQELETLAAGAGVADRVRFWGEVEDDLLPTLIHACDVFVLSSITPNEAFGLVQVEAMACGKPVVSCLLNSGVPYVNQDGVTGLVVPPASSEGLAKAIEKLCSNPQFRASLGENGRQRARSEFSLEVMVRRYWDLFQRVRETLRA
jgi:rhamnosyl/mannosyltransferase